MSCDQDLIVSLHCLAIGCSKRNLNLIGPVATEKNTFKYTGGSPMLKGQRSTLSVGTYL